MRQTTYPVVCERCGQTAVCEIVSGARLVCSPCVTRDHEPQGETVKLFEPAPAQMPGQLGLGAAPRRAGSYECRHCGALEAMPGHYC